MVRVNLCVWMYVSLCACYEDTSIRVCGSACMGLNMNVCMFNEYVCASMRVGVCEYMCACERNT